MTCTGGNCACREEPEFIIRDGTGQVISPSVTESILEEAQRLVYGARAAAYGHPKDNMARIAQIWSVTLGMEVTPRQVALCMVGVKLAREVQVETRDNLVDIAGYAAVADRLAES